MDQRCSLVDRTTDSNWAEELCRSTPTTRFIPVDGRWHRLCWPAHRAGRANAVALGYHPRCIALRYRLGQSWLLHSWSNRNRRLVLLLRLGDQGLHRHQGQTNSCSNVSTSLNVYYMVKQEKQVSVITVLLLESWDASSKSEPRAKSRFMKNDARKTARRVHIAE